MTCSDSPLGVKALSPQLLPAWKRTLLRESCSCSQHWSTHSSSAQFVQFSLFFPCNSRDFLKYFGELWLAQLASWPGVVQNLPKAGSFPTGATWE